MMGGNYEKKEKWERREEHDIGGIHININAAMVIITRLFKMDS